MDKSTASRTVLKVTRAIASLKRNVIRMPETEEELNVTRQEFYNIAKFPKCIRAIDCTHIKVQCPGRQYAETLRRNRKSFFSLNVQVVGAKNCAIRNIVCPWPGASHDSNVFRNFKMVNSEIIFWLVTLVMVLNLI